MLRGPAAGIEKLAKVIAIVSPAVLLGVRVQHLVIDKALLPGNFLQTRDLQALTCLDGLDENQPRHHQSAVVRQE
jgi:hypothetical protein